MKKLSANDMKEIKGGSLTGGCVDGEYCRNNNWCVNPPPGAVDWLCDLSRQVCVYCF